MTDEQLESLDRLYRYKAVGRSLDAAIDQRDQARQERDELENDLNNARAQRDSAVDSLEVAEVAQAALHPETS